MGKDQSNGLGRLGATLQLYFEWDRSKSEPWDEFLSQHHDCRDLLLQIRDGYRDLGEPKDTSELPEEPQDEFDYQTADALLPSPVPSTKGQPSAHKITGTITTGNPALHRIARSADATFTSRLRIKAGMMIGDFRVLSILGRGGMGEVWEAEQVSLSRQVALKLLLPDRVDKRGLDFFAREARAGGRLSHPGIVPIHGTGENDGLHWIAMELVDGACDLRRSLDRAREEGELPNGYHKQVAKFVAEAADALEAAHNEGVIHRDLKPGNILVTPEDRPKISDFGLAKLLDENSISQAGEMVGTCCYMSPEQVAAKRAGLDHRTDIFSLGVVLYEMLTLIRPFDGDTTEQVAHKILVVDPPPASSVRSKVPQDLAVIRGKAMEKDRDRRYRTMAEFAADLRRHLSDHPILAKPPSVLQRGSKWIRRNPTRSTVGAITAVAFVTISKLLLDNVEANDHLANALGFTKVERDRAVAAEQETARQRDRAQIAAYSASIYSASATLEIGNHAEARRQLETCPESMRDWEWAHLELSLDQSMRSLRGHQGTVYSPAWDISGSRIASGSRDKTVRIWDAQSGTCLQVLKGHGGQVYSTTWSPSGIYIASGSGDRTLRIWDARSGQNIRTLRGHTAGIRSVAWHSKGEQLVSGSEDTQLRFWDFKSGECRKTIAAHQGPITCLACDLQDTRVASGSWDKTIRIWDLKSGQLLRTLRAPKATEPEDTTVTSVCWNPAGTRIASGAWDKKIRIWDLESGEVVLTLDAEAADKKLGSSVSSVAWNRSGTRIVSGAGDNTLRIWDADSGQLMQVLRGHEGDVHSAAWNHDGSRIVSSSSDETLRVWASESGDSVHTLTGHETEVRSVSWNSDGTRIASGSEDHAVRIWDARTGANQLTLEGHKNSATSTSWHPDGTRLASGSWDGTIRIWNTQSGEALGVIKGNGERITSIAWNPTGACIAAGLEDNTLRIWNPDNEQQVWILRGHRDLVGPLAWNPSGTRIASGSEDWTVRVWDLETGETLMTLSGHNGAVRSVAWNHRGTQIASASWDATIRIWDAKTGQSLACFKGHQGAVNCLAWNPADTRLASGSNDHTLRIWDTATGESMKTLVGHEQRVHTVAWNPSGSRIVSGAGDRTIKIWETKLSEALPIWRGAAQRNRLTPLVTELFDQHIALEAVLDALRADTSMHEDLRRTAIEMARTRGPLSARYLNGRAWPLVDPDREDRETDIAQGLALAKAAVKSEPKDAAVRDTLAWALFANGHHKESVAESMTALQLAATKDKKDYQAYLDRLRALTK